MSTEQILLTLDLAKNYFYVFGFGIFIGASITAVLWMFIDAKLYAKKKLKLLKNKEDEKE